MGIQKGVYMKREKLDIKYIEELKNGNVDAFNTIFEFYKDSVYYFSQSYVKNNADAEEVVQETFIQVLKNIHKLSNLHSFRAWLHKIAYHIAMDLYRGKANRHIQLDEEFNIEELLIQKEGPKEMLNNKEIVAVIEAEIKKMPPKLVRVAQLRYFDDYTTKEIADIIEVPEGTIKSRLNRIRKIIQPVLEGQGMKPSRHFSVAFAPIMAQVMASTIAGNTLGEEVKEPMKIAILQQAQDTWFENIHNEEYTTGIPTKWKATLALATGGVAGVIGVHNSLDTIEKEGISYVEEIHLPDKKVNHPFEVEVVMDHDVANEKIAVLHNNQKEEFVVDHEMVVFEAEENGEYVVVVNEVKNRIVVNNIIDVTPPEFHAVVEMEDGLIIESSDDNSGVNYQMSYVKYYDQRYAMNDQGFVKGAFNEGMLQINLYDYVGNHQEYKYNLEMKSNA